MKRQKDKGWSWPEFPPFPSMPPIPPIPPMPPMPPMPNFDKIFGSEFGKMFDYVPFYSSQTRAETKTVAGENGKMCGAGHTRTNKEPSMRNFLLVYEPKGGGNPGALATTLKKLKSWWSYLDRVWIISTDESADELWGRLSGLFGKNDNVLVIELPAGPERQGWLPTAAWEWFNKAMPRGAKESGIKAAKTTKLSIPYGACQDGGEVLIVPEGVRVCVTRGAESVYFGYKPDAPAQKKTPAQQPKPATKNGSPTVDENPQDSAQIGNLVCEFCGREAPADAWVDGDCPRCGIRRSE